jgi:hypothetical protein
MRICQLAVLAFLAGLAVAGWPASAPAATGQATAAGTTAQRPPDGPSLKVSPQEINLGKVRLGKRVRAVFTVSNAGNQLLKFTKSPYIEVKSGCCPPVIMLDVWALKPGERATISMEFVMTGNRRGPYDYRVHLQTNDPVQPDRTVTVLSNWVP